VLFCSVFFAVSQFQFFYSLQLRPTYCYYHYYFKYAKEEEEVFNRLDQEKGMESCSCFSYCSCSNSNSTVRGSINSTKRTAKTVSKMISEMKAPPAAATKSPPAATSDPRKRKAVAAVAASPADPRRRLNTGDIDEKTLTEAIKRIPDPLLQDALHVSTIISILLLNLSYFSRPSV
jgi:hypothetical protein